MKIIRISLILLFTFTYCQNLLIAQSGTGFQWVRQGSSSKKDRGEDITTDNSGNVIVTGHFAGTATFGSISITSSNNTRDMFVAKYDQNGNTLWVKRGGGTGVDRGTGVTTDASGNIFITGSFTGPATFGSQTVNTAGGEDIFTVKYNSSGVAQWVRSGGGNQGDWPSSLATDASGNVYVTGQIRSTANFGSTQLTSAGDKDIILVKYDSNGTLQWVKRAGGTLEDTGKDIVVDGSNIIITGYFKGTAQFTPSKSLSSAGDYDMFIASYNSSGGVNWVKRYGGSGENRGKAITVDPSGRLFVAGNTSGAMTIGSDNLNSNGNNEGYVAKFDPSGNAIWGELMKGVNGVEQFGITVAGDGSQKDVIVTGSYSNTGNFGGNEVTSRGLNDIFVVSYQRTDRPSGGVVRWVKSAGGSGEDYGDRIVNSASGVLVATGRFSGNSAVFDSFTLQSSGQTDIFVARIGAVAGPLPPSSLAATTVSSSQIILNWRDNSSNETGFKIERRVGQSGSFQKIAQLSANSTSYQDTGLNPNTEYCYRVRAYNSQGNSSYTSIICATTQGSLPNPPTNLTASTVSSARINLSWSDNSNNELGFKLERRVGQSGNFSQIAQLSANTVSYQDAGLNPNTEYCYRVRAYNSQGNSSYSSIMCATTSDVLPNPPTNLTASTVSSARINLSWSDNSNNELGFKLERRVGQSGNFSQIAQLSANTVSYQDAGLNPNTEYCYRLHAFNSQGNSSYSNTMCATTPDVVPDPPTNLTASTVSSAQIVLSWQDNSTNETGFRIERRMGQGGSFTEIAVVGPGVVGYQDTGLVANTEFCYQVRAYNSVNPSNYSNIACATTQDIPPSPPTALDAVRVSTSQISLTWVDNSNNEDGFKIERRIAQSDAFQLIAVLGVNSVNSQDTGLQVNTEYCYRVLAFNSEANSPYSNIACATTSTQRGPVAEFSGNTRAGQAPLTVSFTDASTVGDTVITGWSWDFQDDGTADSRQQNPTHTYSDTGSFTVRLTVTDANGLTDTEIKQNYIVVSPASVDTDPPIIQPPAASSASAGNNVTITTTITDASALADVAVNYRRGGEPAFQKASMTLAGANAWQGDIPANFVTDRGVEYFISARDAASNKSQTQLLDIRVAVTNISSSFPANSYRFISIPIQANDFRPLTIFSDISDGTYDRSKWRLFTTAPDQTNLPNPRRPYLEFQIDGSFNLAAGRAYWLIVKNLYQVNTGSGASVNTTNSFVRSLTPGWNFVATPYTFPTPLSKIRLESGTSLEGRLWSYTGSGFVQMDSNSNMQPFSGYALQVENQDKLFIEINGATSSQSRENRTDQVASGEDEWAIRIRAEIEGHEDAYNFAAVSNEASAGWDQFDNPEPPVIGDYVSVYFPHPEWQKLSNFYCVDVRPFSAKDGEIWEFQVVSNLQDRIDLNFEGLEKIPYNLDIYLLDEVVKVSQDLRKDASYSVASQGESYPRSLKLVVAENSRQHEYQGDAPEIFELTQNYPNPFNPSTTIRFGLPEASEVRLAIYNLLGKEIAVLIDGELRNAGFNSELWDGRDKAGNLVASGVYLYRLGVGGKSITRKMAFMK